MNKYLIDLMADLKEEEKYSLAEELTRQGPTPGKSWTGSSGSQERSRR